MSPILSFLVLRTSQMEKVLEFYQALGLHFVEEQHGKGPVHFAAQHAGFVLEIFPGSEGLAPPRLNGGATMLGFQMPNLSTVLEVLAPLGYEPLNPPRETQWGMRAVMVDPDGRDVELNQPITEKSSV